jgi:acyl carrier protein
MTAEEVKEKIFEIVAQHYGKEKEEINEDTHFVADLGADSLGVVEMK